MKSITRSCVLALALGALGAMGGFTPDVATAEATASVSPFAGSWSGTWSAVEVELVGTYDWTISKAGRITGTIYGTTSGRSGTIVGKVDADGRLVLIRYVPNDEPSTGYGSYAFEATAVIDGDGRLVAWLRGRGSNTSSHVAILERSQASLDAAASSAVVHAIGGTETGGRDTPLR